MNEKLLLELPETLETDRLIIRKYVKGDGHSFLDLLNRGNNREDLRDSVDEAMSIADLNDAEINVREHEAEWASRERFVMGIWSKDSGEAIGQIWIEPKDWDVPSFELGWFIDSGRQGKGLATEAAQRSLEFIFTELQAHKVVVVVKETNERSLKLAERIGCIREGLSRDHGVKDGTRYSLVFFSMLRSEFDSLVSG
jgi:ribosomal-protein-serine acetyltransferase